MVLVSFMRLYKGICIDARPFFDWINKHSESCCFMLYRLFIQHFNLNSYTVYISFCRLSQYIYIITCNRTVVIAKTLYS